jgi:energy-converting hydrogenase Eha subunit B
MAERVDVRAAVLHHRQDPGCAGARAVLLRPIGIAMAAVQSVEISRLVRGMNRHPGKARLLEIEHARASELVGQVHAITRARGLDTA